MTGRNTAPPGFSQSTKRILPSTITLLKDVSNYSDSSCALARTNGRSHSFVLEFSLLLSLLQGKESDIGSSRHDDRLSISSLIISFPPFVLKQKVEPKIQADFDAEYFLC